MSAESRLLLTYYGDDFTGSTDSTEVLEWAGVPSVLFLEPPTLDLIRSRFPHVQAVGLAGVSRSMSPTQMDAVLPSLFTALKALGAPAFHYKICSTFDSSPTLGSIGHAIEIALGVFGAQTVPLVVGAPFLKRYVAFSNLFARVDDTTYRLDRHPTMSCHPTTPMHEADLRLHLAEQTARRIGSINVLHLAEAAETLWTYFDELRQQGIEIIIFDTIDDGHLLAVGGLLDRVITQRTDAGAALLVGSSGIEKALALHWQASGRLAKPPTPVSAGAVEQLIVVSGSAAPATAMQLDWAEAHGFAMERLDSVRLVDPAAADEERTAVIARALERLSAGQSVVLYSVRGPDDPQIIRTKAHLDALGIDPRSVGARLGTQQGLILRKLLKRTGLRRAVVTGGDTCGYAARQLGIYALRTILPVAPGAPLCLAYADDAAFDGLEISLKAGQVGKVDYFGSILKGSQ